MIALAERLCTLDDTLVTEWAKVELLFPDTAEADGLRSDEEVEGKLPLSTDVDGITTASEEVCALSDNLVTD